MHIVGTDLCRRLDIEVEIATHEMTYSWQGRFCYWWMTLLACFTFGTNTLGGSFACCFLYIWRFGVFTSVEICNTQMYHRV